MDYAVYSAKEEKNLYDSLKKGMPYVLTELQKNEVEILSILENVGRMGVTLPDFLMNVLSELKKGINNKK